VVSSSTPSSALQQMLTSGHRELVVVDSGGSIAGFLDEAEIQAAYHRATTNEGN